MKPASTRVDSYLFISRIPVQHFRIIVIYMYYTTDERVAAAQAMKIISTSTTWNNIVRYFL
jgi:uncharacterized membrane protein